MRVVGLKILKNKLSEYVRLAAAGETILVTDRDHVIAELGPARQERSQMTADAVLADAVRKGWITPPLGSIDGPPSRLPVMPIEALLKALEADREGR
jgi:antitoxin (DNA-binding transcriptional repressor) of toxin-antitoxin stability system